MGVKRRVKDEAEKKAFGHLRKNWKKYVKTYVEFKIFQKIWRKLWKKIRG